MPAKYLPIQLDKMRNLRFGMGALIEIEKKIGKPFAKIDFENEMSFEELSIVLWGGLVHEDSELTPSKVAALVDDYSDLATVMESIGKAMLIAFGKGKNSKGTVTLPNGIGIQSLETPSVAG